MKEVFRSILLASLFIVLLSSCKNDEVSGRADIPETAVSFVIGGDQTTTKSAANAGTINTIEFLEEPEIEGLILTETVTDIDDYYFPAEVITKGTPIYTENFDEILGEFTGNAYIPENTGKAYSDSDIQGGKDADFGLIDTRTYYHDYKSALTWPSDGSGLLFFLKANQSDAVSDVTYYAPGTKAPLGSIHFNYTSPSGTNADAEAQNDILFTSQLINKEESDDNRILFYHALTGVKFQNGNVADGEQKIFIRKVELNGIVGSGSCIITPNYTAKKNTSAGNNESNAKTTPTDVSKSAQCSLWEPGEATGKFSQTFSGLVQEYGGKGTVPDSFEQASNGDWTSVNNLNKADFSQTFMMIPQELGDNATATVYYSFTDGNSTNTKVFKSTASLKGQVWKAGELHTYTLNINGLQVEITDKVDKRVKSEIVTRNSGTTIAYLRCALASNWVYDDPDTKENENVIVAANDALKTGEFIGDSGKSGLCSNWLIGSDGYLYYTKPVLPGNSTIYPVFTRYYAPEKTPYKDSHLEINIALQGVQFNESQSMVEKAWNVDKVYVMEPVYTGGVITGLNKSENTILSQLDTNPESAK